MEKNPTPTRNTVREALFAELFGEADKLLGRVETLPGTLDATTKALEAASDKYRLAVTAFTDQAKQELSEFLDQKTGQAAQAAARTAEEQRGAMQEAARLAFRAEASDKAASLGSSLVEAAKQFRRSIWLRVGEHTVTAFLAAGLTAAFMHTVFK